jgi:O-antigen ligase
MAVTAVACAISILTVVDDIQQKLSISTDASLSANDIGAIMAFGVFAILFCVGKREKPSFILSALKVAGIICALVVIFLAGSRKSITAVLIMLVLMVLLCLSDYTRYQNIRQILITIVICIVAYNVVSKYLLPYAEQTNLYTRLVGKGAEAAESSDQIRIDFYRWAVQDFLAHPFWGLGYNQFTNVHGDYSHSTYAEPIACSGMIGFLYLYPYYSMLKKQIYLIWRNPKGSLERLKQKEIFIYLCMFLFIAAGIPFMYKDVPCILLGTFIASQAISFEEIRTTGRTSVSY